MPPRRLRWLPVNLGSAADLGGLLTLVTQNWVGAAIFGAVGLVLGVAQIARSRGHLVGRAVLLAVVAVAIGGVTFGFAVDRLIVAAGDGSHVGQAVTGPAGASTTSAPLAPAPVRAPEAATTKSLLDVPSFGDAYKQSPQKVNGIPAERVLSNKLLCYVVGSAISEDFQLGRKFRVFRAQVGLTDESDSEPQVKFIVRVDGEDRASTVVRVGELQPLEVDVSGGFRMELHAEVTDPVNCDGSAIAAWVDPMVTQ